MSLFEFLNRLMGRQKPSGTQARERLQLVLAHDRSDLNPELLMQMRREILEVVQRYVEIDLEGCDVSLETEDRVTALLANLPIKRALPRPDLVNGSAAIQGGGPVEVQDKQAEPAADPSPEPASEHALSD